MQKLIVLRGNAASGKSTVARELQKKFGENTMVISQDEVRRNMLHVKDGENTEAIGLSKVLLSYGHSHCDVVILEGIMYADWYKPLFELAAWLYGTQVYAYYFDLPFEETLRRHQTRAKSKEFGEESLRRWWREKDFSDVLNEVRITSEKDMETIVNEIYGEVYGEV